MMAGPWLSIARFFSDLIGRALVDYARGRQAAKRGARFEVVPLDEAAIVGDERAAELVSLDEALRNLVG